MNRILLAVLLTLITDCLFAQQTIQKDSIDNSDHIRILLQLAHRNMQSNVPMAEFQAESALNLAEKVNDNNGVMLASFYLGQIYGTKISNFNKGIYYHNKSLQKAIALNNITLVARNHFDLGTLHYNLGHWGRALKHLSSSIGFYSGNHDLLSESFARIRMAAIYSESSNKAFSKVRLDFERALLVAKKMKNDSLFITTAAFYTTAMIANNQFDKAEKYLNKALIIAKLNDRYPNVTQQLYSNLGDVFFHDGMFKAAIHHYEISKAICERFKIRSELPSRLLKLGKVYFRLDELVLAKKNYKDAMESFAFLRMKKKLAEVYNELSVMEYAQNNYEPAFKYKSLQMALQDSLSSDQSDLLFDFQSRMLMDKTAILRKDKDISWLSTNLIFVIILGGCLFGLFYLNSKRLLAAKVRSSHEKEKIILEKELQNKRLQEEKLTQQLEFNAKSLAVNTLNMIQKNEILLQIKEKVEEMRTAPIEMALTIRSKELVHLVSFGLNIDKDWENFSLHFEQIHNGFFDELKSKYPNLNSSDLKLCALLKLNLDTKEIAAIMNISPQSVKVARSRLRKKLELNLTSNLSAFITQIHS